jgi:hypothetical protein
LQPRKVAADGALGASELGGELLDTRALAQRLLGGSLKLATVSPIAIAAPNW